MLNRSSFYFRKVKIPFTQFAALFTIQIVYFERIMRLSRLSRISKLRMENFMLVRKMKQKLTKQLLH